MPSTITAVSSSRDTTPVARLAYQGAVLAVIPFISSTLAGVSPLKLEDSSVPAQNVCRSEPCARSEHVPAQSKRGSGAAGRRMAGARTRRRRGRPAAETRARGAGIDELEPASRTSRTSQRSRSWIRPSRNRAGRAGALVPDDEPVEPEDPDEEEPCEDDVPLVCEPGSIRVTTPAVATLASLTATVVLLIRLRPRARAAIARRTCSRFGVFMTGSLPSASGNFLCTGSQPPMSLDAMFSPGAGRIVRGRHHPSPSRSIDAQG